MRWAKKKTAASVGGGGTYCDTPNVYPDPDHKPLHRPVLRGGSNVYSGSGALSYGRLEMNKKRPTAYDGSGALFFSEGCEGASP